MGALFWRASDLANITREALGHHLEACFAARFPQEGIGQGSPTVQEFITKTTQELQDARAMRGDRRSRGVAPHPGEDVGLHVCIDVPGLNRATSQECFWPSRVASAYQRNMRQVLAAQEARYHAVLEEMETVFKEPPKPPEPPEAQGPGGS